jgi:hypothetical protein
MSPANTMSEMPLQARRVFRLSLTAALSLACAYGLQLPLPFIAPVFAIMLTITPAPPMGLKSLLGLILIVLMTLGIGLLLIPLLLQYALTAVLLVALGLYLSFYLSLHHGKVLVGTLLTVGFTMISAAGTVNFSLATTVIQALVIGISVAIACQWLVYPWFAEDAAHAKPAATTPCDAEQSHWLALRGTLIMLPTYLLALSNPAFYMPILMKTSSLSHQSNLTSAREAGRELLGSTFLAGCFAILFWVMLSIAANLWMFFWLMLLFSLYFSSKIYRLIESRFSAAFWSNVAITLLILLGPSVQDSDNGKDVYSAFFVRMCLFVAVTLYAWLALYVLEYLRTRRRHRRASLSLDKESPTC